MFSDVYVFEPPKPIRKSYYKCDKVFHLDDLLELYTVYDTYAIVLISGKRTDFYEYSKNDVKLIKSVSVELQSQSKKGGSSSARYCRIVASKHDAYIKYMSELMFNFYVKDNVFQHIGLILAGPTMVKDQIQLEPLFLQHFQKYLLNVITTPEITDNTINIVTDIMTEQIYGTSVDNKIIDKFEQIINDEKQIDLIVFGKEYVLTELENNNLAEIYVDDNFVEVIDIKLLNNVKVNIIQNKTFIKKYGEIVGLKYYALNFEEMNDNDI
jgi:peptide subunit release factor 1 (eRF1)